MRCDTAYSLIQDFVDGLLSGEMRQRVETHLQGCAKCAAAVSEYTLMNSALDDTLQREAVPAGFADRVIDLLKAAGQIERPKGIFGWVRAPLRAPLAAAVVVLVALALFPVTVHVLEAMVGKGTVLVAETYIELEEKATDVSVFTTLAASVQSTLRTLKTIGLAGVSLVARAVELFMIPATAMLIALIGGAFIYLRSLRRRSTPHVSLSI